MSGAAVGIVGLCKHYGSGESAVHAVRDLSLSIAPGEFLCVMGPSGSGKSTLLHLIAGLCAASSGSVRLDDVEITALEANACDRFRRRNVGLVFQSFHLVPSLSLRQNVALPLLMDGVRIRDARARVDALLERVGLLDRVHHRLDQLSGGQLQRIAICRALVGNPRLVLADEPTGNLDARRAEDVLALLRAISTEQGCTTLVVTHDPGAQAHADRTLQIRDGGLPASPSASARA